MEETNHFFNLGYGWVCKHCSAAETERLHVTRRRHARFFHEGEAEDKEPVLSTPALARWTDAARQGLSCPRCGIQELLRR